MKDLVLGFHYHVPALRKAEGVWTPAFQGRFLDSLALHCRELVCFLHDQPGSDEMGMMDYRLQGSNIKLVGLGPHDSVPMRLFRANKVIKQARQGSGHLDAILLRGPSPLLPEFASMYSSTPLVLLLVGDLSKGIGDLPQPLFKKAVIAAWVHWNKWEQNRLISKSLTFVNSRPLYRELESKSRNIFEISTTLLSEEDFRYREDTCQKSEIRLLYTGRMSRSKGLMEALDAVSILRKEGKNIYFDLVGPQEKGDSFVRDLERNVTEKGLREAVFYHGYQPLGPTLFSFYQRADIFLMPSQTSEGFPRALWEAMAQGLPVAASRVGAVPDVLEDGKNAVLIKPKSPEAIVFAVQRILGDGSFRKGLILNGFELARRFTCENQTALMTLKITEWLKENRSL